MSVPGKGRPHAGGAQGARAQPWIHGLCSPKLTAPQRDRVSPDGWCSGPRQAPAAPEPVEGWWKWVGKEMGGQKVGMVSVDNSFLSSTVVNERSECLRLRRIAQKEGGSGCIKPITHVCLPDSTKAR